MVPTIVLTALFAIFSVRHALQPLTRVSQQVENIDPKRPDLQIDSDRLPREAASFAKAINRLLARLTGIINAQDEFLRRAAHELRTPLAIMQLEAEKIKDDGARRLEGAIAEMADMVDRLLHVARIDAARAATMQEIELCELATDALRRLQPLAELHQSRLCQRSTGALCFRGDRLAIREAMRNLVLNGIIHTPPGTTVTVTCGPGAAVTVEDDGPGLPGGNIAALFEPFVRGPASAGAGLGLAIVQRAVDRHNGRIEVGRSAQGGALFRLHFVSDKRPTPTTRPAWNSR